MTGSPAQVTSQLDRLVELDGQLASLVPDSPEVNK